MLRLELGINAYDAANPICNKILNERHISVVNQILTKKRTNLSDEYLEKLAVLRMNRMFMRKMKKAFPTLALRLANFHASKIRDRV